MTHPVDQNSLHIVAQRVTDQNKVEVTLSNNEKYEIEVFKGGQNVTRDRDWSSVFQRIEQLFQASTGQRKYESASVTLTGNFDDLQAADFENKQVQFKGVVKYQDASGILQQQTLPQREVVLNRLQELGNTYRGIAPVAAAAPAAQYYNIEDERLDTVKDRPCEIPSAPPPEDALGAPEDQPYAYYALARQLIQIPSGGKAKFNEKTMHEIMGILVGEMLSHLNEKITGENKEQWINANIKDMVESLNKARLLDRDVFIMALTDININRGEQALTIAAMDDLFTQPNIVNLNPDQKEIIANLYHKYISTTKCKFVGTTFFKLFVELHEQANKQDYFQIVLIRENEDGKQTAISIPEGRDIETDRCAFIHIDADENYSSYNRGGSGDLHDLNTKQRIGSSLKRTPVPEPSAAAAAVHAPIAPVSSLKTIDTNFSGRCLDMSVAYQLMKKKYPNMSEAEILNSEELTNLANDLRVEAAKLIKKEPDAENNEFYDRLKNSILEIPAFSPHNEKYTDDMRNESLRSMRTFINENELAAIAGTLAKNVIKFNNENKRQLKEFYSEYILQQNADTGQFFNYLDSAFFHILPKIDKVGIPPIKCALIQNNRLFGGRYEATLTELNSNDWIFLEYNGHSHFKAINMANAKTKGKVDSIIAKEKEKEINELRSIENSAIVKTRLLDEIRYRDPQAYTAFCRLVWKYFHDEWKKTNEPAHQEPGRPYPEPVIPHAEGKTLISPQTNVVLDVEGFGKWKLEQDLKPDQIQQLLRSFSAKDITDAMRSVPPA